MSKIERNQINYSQGIKASLEVANRIIRKSTHTHIHGVKDSAFLFFNVGPTDVGHLFDHHLWSIFNISISVMHNFKGDLL